MRRLGIIVGRCDDIISGDSITMMYNVLIAFARNAGDGSLMDSNNKGNKEGNSGRRISLGTLAMMLDNAIK